ncbi:MAG: ankyrin repeat domain-containing protein, partial [Wolbachia sp.]
MNYSEDRRRIFTWIPQTKDSQSVWKMEPYGDNVYIKNVKQNEYLYAALDHLNYNKNRRQVFTWVPGDRNSHNLWKIESNGNYSRIKNVKYNEYLYAVDYLDSDEKRRKVCTFVPGSTHVQSEWKIEPDSDNVYIKNVNHNEYLYAVDRPDDKDRRRVFTWIPQTKDSQSVWKMEPYGDNFFIVNVKYNRHLYAADSKYSGSESWREIFTWRSRGRDDEYQWKIVDCGSIRNRRDVQELDSKVNLDSDGTQISESSSKLQNDLLLNRYNQSILDQYLVSKISAIVKNIQEFVFLSQSENKLDLGRCLSERKKRSSNFCPAFLENIHNELNREESERRNIVLEESSIRVITSDHETLDIEDLPIREVVINDNINRKRSLRSTLDLRRLVQQINEDLGIKPISMVIKDASDLLIKLSILATGLQQDVITVRLKDALINKWYKKLQIICDNAPMEIDNSLDLKPSLLISDKRIIVVTPQEVEEKNKLVISKKAGQYSYLHDKYDLIVTNAFNASIMTNNLDSSIEVGELFIIYFKDFYKEPKMKTLSIRFADKEVLLIDEIDKIYNSESADKLNYVSSILNLQESSLPLEVSSSSDIEAQGKFKRTPLHFASEAGEWDKVRLLLNRGANIEVQDEFFYTPIFLATQSGKWSIVRLLLDKGANIDARDKEGQTLLCFAVSGNNLDMIQFLLDRGASIEAQDKSGYTPILYAAQSGKWSVVKLFIDNGAKFNNETTFQGTPLHFAVQEGNLDMVQFLLDKGAGIEVQNAYNEKPLHFAVKAGRLDILKLLLDRGANINATDMDGQTPLDLATHKGYNNVVEILRQAQLNLDKELLIAAEKGDLEKVRDSIIRGANAQDSQSWTPLFWAIQKNNLNIVKLLVNNGADINAKDNEGWTSLHWA